MTILPPTNSSQWQRAPNGNPRRIDTTQRTAIENEIQDLVWRIEKLGGSPRLTDCVTALSDARNYLADHIEGLE